MNSESIEQPSPLAVDVRTQSPDRYLATLFAPPERRDSLFALYAFDHEIARVQMVVREPMAGLVRLQWWDDVIDGFKRDDNVAHPVVMALQRAVTEGELNAAYLKRAVDGRRRLFEEEQPSGPEFWEHYLIEIGGSIACAAAALLGADAPETLAVADRVGAVSATWEEVSALNRNAMSPTLRLENESEEIGSWARREIADARRQSASITRAELPAFLPGTLAEIRLRDPAHYVQRPFLSTAVPRLAWCWLRGRF
ncbi:MAG: squalene/phytoene synthase family protein [Geminicoccaceae bacterium]